MRKTRSSIILFLSSILLWGCGNLAQPTVPLTVTLVPDPCGPDSLPAEVDKVHKFMREFDDSSLLASNTPLDQLTDVISNMQSIRRNAEDQTVPACLVDLKKIQLAHMDTVISTLIGFLGGGGQNSLNAGAELARQQHNQYALEYARLLGLTVVVPPSPTALAQATETPVPTVLVVTNPGPSDVNLYSVQVLGSPVVGVLISGQSAKALLQSPDGQWIQVEIPDQPGQIAWVQSSAVTISSVPAQ